jgi:hypothetical protein
LFIVRLAYDAGISAIEPERYRVRFTNRVIDEVILLPSKNDTSEHDTPIKDTKSRAEAIKQRASQKADSFEWGPQRDSEERAAVKDSEDRAAVEMVSPTNGQEPTRGVSFSKRPELNQI